MTDPAGGLDVLVVGGGPAGLATAIAARLQGLERVRVVDRARPVIDKACGEGLMPDGLESLRALGVAPERLRAAPITGIRYLDGDTVVEASFPRGCGLGARRLVLHEALVARAEAVGVELAWGTKVLGVTAGGVTIESGEIRARFVVAADGLHSPLRRAAGLAGKPEPRRTQRFGVRCHFRVEPWTDRVEVHWVDGCEAYVTPVAADELGIAFLWSGGPARFDQLLARFPTLAWRLKGAERTSKPRGAGPLLQRVRRVTKDNLALVGDAAGYVDAITGEGLSVAFHEARALGEALAAGDLSRYQRAHRRIVRLPETMTRLVLALERRPRLRHRALKALAAEPELFARLLGIHTRALPARQLGLPATLKLVLRLAGV